MPLHVIQRGNNRGACFFSQGDRLQYLAVLAELSRKYDCVIHAYVLMTNHVHLLCTPNCVNAISSLMRHLGQRYVQYVNRVHGRTGSLWDGRFRSSLVDTDSYYIACQRYIEMNPVRAGMVARADDYPWSTFRVHAWGRPDTLITHHAEYLALGADEASRTAAYRELCATESPPEWLEKTRNAVNAGRPLGSAAFEHEIERRVGHPIRGRGRPVKSVARPDGAAIGSGSDTVRRR